MKRKIENEYDYLVAYAESATDNARRVLNNARADNDYWKEKVAAKLAEFAEHEEKALRLYAEAKTQYPELGELIEKYWKHYKNAADEARLQMQRESEK